jgi:hypothetical protein
MGDQGVRTKILATPLNPQYGWCDTEGVLTVPLLYHTKGTAFGSRSCWGDSTNSSEISRASSVRFWAKRVLYDRKGTVKRGSTVSRVAVGWSDAGHVDTTFG